MKNLLFPILLAMYVHSLSGQQPDSLFSLDELTYNSVFEKDAVYDFFHSENPDYLSLFIASSGKTSLADYQKIRDNYTSFYQKLNTKKLKTNSEPKKIKTIYKTVHDQYFKKYELKTKFGEIFSSGNFNCVTASALYAIILNDMGVPFIVKETPVHVYLVAYPDVKNIKIESTDPLDGYYYYDQRGKTSFIDYLLKNKLISEEEYRNSQPDEIFNKYFYSDKDIHLRELLGLHYLNQGVYKIMDKNLKEGYNELEKAYVFYPSERVRFLLLSTLSELINNQNYTEPEYIQYLAKVARFRNYGARPEDIQNEFIRITNYHLINRSNVAYYDSVYNYLISNIQDDEINNEINFIYYFEKGRFFYAKGMNQAAHECFSGAYLIKPKNSDAQAAFVQSLALSLNNCQPAVAVKTIEDYYENDSSLENNQLFKKLLLHAYLVGAHQSYSLNQPAKGDSYISRFESMCESDEGIELLQDVVGEAYTSASVYYFRKGNISKARELISRGLKYAPGNFQLIMSQQSF